MIRCETTYRGKLCPRKAMWVADANQIVKSHKCCDFHKEMWERFASCTHGDVVLTFKRAETGEFP